MMPRAFGPAMLCWVMALATPARADDRSVAEAKFHAGVAMFEAENYPAALAAFEESYHLVPKTSVLYNIGMCQKALYRYVDSIATFNAYLKEAVSAIPVDKRLKAEAAVKEMEKLLGTLAVDGAPDGADILLDGNKIGKTPLKAPLAIDPGEHTVHVAKSGYDTLETKISVSSGETVSVPASLKPLVAKLIVDCRAEDAVIKVDGKVVGGCPTRSDVASGTHEVTVSSSTIQSFTRTVEVGPGGEVTVSVAPVAAPSNGDTRTAPFQSSPESARPGETAVPPENMKGKRTHRIVAGTLAVVVGAGMGALGAAFTFKGYDDNDRGDAIYHTMQEADTAGDGPSFAAEEKQYKEIRNSDIPRDYALMVTGYVLGGALVATGITFLVRGWRTERPTNPIALSPFPGGVSVEF